MLKIDKLLKKYNVRLLMINDPDFSHLSWESVGKVGVNREHSLISVPKARRDARHFASVLHELAHLLIWRETGVRPAEHLEPSVCIKALTLAKEGGLSFNTLELLALDLRRTVRYEYLEGA
jgi:hypothetical protein